MFRTETISAFRPNISTDDWKLIIKALDAYSHNSEYRDLMDRLETQASTVGALKQTRLSD